MGAFASEHSRAETPAPQLEYAQASHGQPEIKKRSLRHLCPGLTLRSDPFVHRHHRLPTAHGAEGISIQESGRPPCHGYNCGPCPSVLADVLP